MTQPKPNSLAQPTARAGVFAGETAEDHDGNGDEQHKSKRALAAALSPRDQRYNENTGRKKRRRHPENRQLNVPCAHDVKR